LVDVFWDGLSLATHQEVRAQGRLDVYGVGQATVQLELPQMRYNV